MTNMNYYSHHLHNKINNGSNHQRANFSTLELKEQFAKNILIYSPGSRILHAHFSTVYFYFNLLAVAAPCVHLSHVLHLQPSLPSGPAPWWPAAWTKPHPWARSHTPSLETGRAGCMGSARWRSERLAVLHTEPLAACNSRGLGLGGGRAEVHRFSDQKRKLGQERRFLSPNIPGSFWMPQLSHLTDNHWRDQSRWLSKGVILGQEHVYLKAQQILCFPFDSRFLVPLGSSPSTVTGWG